MRQHAQPYAKASQQIAGPTATYRRISERLSACARKKKPSQQNARVHRFVISAVALAVRPAQVVPARAGIQHVDVLRGCVLVVACRKDWVQWKRRTEVFGMGSSMCFVSCAGAPRIWPRLGVSVSHAKRNHGGKLSPPTSPINSRSEPLSQAMRHPLRSPFTQHSLTPLLA